MSVEAINHTACVYFLSHPGTDYNGLLKIGKHSKGTPYDRIKTLDSTGMLESFVCEAFIQCKNATQLELRIHKILNEYRHKKEFFKISLDDALHIIRNSLTAEELYDLNIRVEKITISDYKGNKARSATQTLLQMIDTTITRIDAMMPTKRSYFDGEGAEQVQALERLKHTLKDLRHRILRDRQDKVDEIKSLHERYMQDNSPCSLESYNKMKRDVRGDDEETKKDIKDVNEEIDYIQLHWHVVDGVLKKRIT
jgi:hypothetical protein